MHEKLRQLIDDSGRSLADIAANSKVSYTILFKWHRGLTKTLDVEHAEQIYRTLTGRKFL